MRALSNNPYIWRTSFELQLVPWQAKIVKILYVAVIAVIIGLIHVIHWPLWNGFLSMPVIDDRRWLSMTVDDCRWPSILILNILINEIQVKSSEMPPCAHTIPSRLACTQDPHACTHDPLACTHDSFSDYATCNQRNLPHYGWQSWWNLLYYLFILIRNSIPVILIIPAQSGFDLESN